MTDMRYLTSVAPIPIADLPVLDALVAQFGVTFNFGVGRPVGQYANGDYWVLGPVSIASITPEGTTHSGTDGDGVPYAGRVVHGTMVNPGNRVFAVGGLLANNTNNSNQGWDTLGEGIGGLNAYEAGFNVDPGKTGSPLAVTTGSVVKFVSNLDSLPIQNRPAGNDMVVLSVVDAIPADNAIRPGIARAAMASPCSTSDFDLTVFQSLAAPATAPTYAEVLDGIDRAIESTLPDFINNTSSKGINNHPEYGRNVGNLIHQALLYLHLDIATDAERTTILSHLMALADDLVARAEENSVTLGGGGGNQWKKPVIAVCAAVLGASAPASWLTYLGSANNYRWAEDSQVFTVGEFDIALPRFTTDGRPRDPYTYEMLGSAEWGEAASYLPERSGSNWDAYYRDVVAYSLIGGTLAVELTTGAKTLWDHPEFWLYMDTVHLRRNEGSPGNTAPAFVVDMLDSFHPAEVAAPAIAAAGIKNDTVWIRFDQALDELAAFPAIGDFVVKVNAAAVTINSVKVWRQNIGLVLAAPVAGNDTVTVSYTPGVNRVRSVDAVEVAGFTDQALTNLTDKVGGPNAAYPVVEFPVGTKRTLSGDGLWAAADGATFTLALMGFRFEALPASDCMLIGHSSGTPPLRVYLKTDGKLEFQIRDDAGSLLARVQTTALTPGTSYNILLSADAVQATAAAGINCFIDGVEETLGVVTWTGGAGKVFGWTRNGFVTTYLNFSDLVAFRFGALWLDTSSRLDITLGTERDKFTNLTSGDLDIGTLGDGITGSQPSQFLVGNDVQWNSGAGMNRGSAAGRWFVDVGQVNLISGSEWI